MNKNRYRLFKRRSTYYVHDSITGRQTSLKTTNHKEAQRLLTAKNDAGQNRELNIALGRTYLTGHDEKLPKRTWAQVMEVLKKRGKPSTQNRSTRALNSKPFDLIRNRCLVETNAEHFLEVIEAGGNSTNHYLRRLHNLARGFDWMPWNVIAPAQWPKQKRKKRRAITYEEYKQILSRETNAERRDYYELIWETGASQSDAAMLTSSNINWHDGVLTYERAKLADQYLEATTMPARIRIGPQLRVLLEKLPKQGPLFPHISQIGANHRASEFRRRCRQLGFEGISLHSFRYSWAERAKAAGYPQRWAQSALGHNSRAVHDAYARGADITCPSLEEYSSKIIPFDNPQQREAQS